MREQVSTDYLITWTMPYCVLCLRMIGTAFDVMDGTLPEDKRSSDQAGASSRIAAAHAAQKVIALAEVPSLLEMAGHSFFFGGVLVGPQFPFATYRAFVTGQCWSPAPFHCFALLNRVLRAHVHDNAQAGCMGRARPSLPAPSCKGYCASPRACSTCSAPTSHSPTFPWPLGPTLPSSASVTGSAPASHVLQDWSVASKLGFVYALGALTLKKYVGIWVLNESSCIVSGIRREQHTTRRIRSRMAAITARTRQAVLTGVRWPTRTCWPSRRRPRSACVRRACIGSTDLLAGRHQVLQHQHQHLGHAVCL